MAFEYPVLKVPALEAGADLSASQFRCVKMSAADRRVVLCDSDGEVLLGVLQNKPAMVGEAAEVTALGVTKIVAGENLAAGDSWGTDISGRARKIEPTTDAADYVAGLVLEGAAADQIATVTVGFPTFKQQ